MSTDSSNTATTTTTTTTNKNNTNNTNTNHNNTTNNQQNEMHRQRRGSVTQQAIAGLFRSSTTSTGTAFTTATSDAQRRRLSVSTGLGLTGTSPTGPSPFNSLRRGSLSTNSNDSIDENAIDEDEIPPNARTAPTTPFARRMSFGAQAMRNLRSGGGSPGSNEQGFNWSEQLRSRAESSVQGPRPSFSFSSGLSSSPPRGYATDANHDRTKSVSDMPAPPVQAAAMKPKAPERPKPDAFQERILKGDFYMD